MVADPKPQGAHIASYLPYDVVQAARERILWCFDSFDCDGFHRVTIARLNNWEVPCCVLDLPEQERMLLTVRINRAKGTHVALRMSDLVQKLLALGCTEEYIAEQIGGTEKEIEILKKGDIFKSLDLSNWQYSRAWLPKPYTRATAARTEQATEE